MAHRPHAQSALVQYLSNSGIHTSLRQSVVVPCSTRPARSRVVKHCSGLTLAEGLAWIIHSEPAVFCRPGRGLPQGVLPPRGRAEARLTVIQAAILHVSFWRGPGMSFEMSVELVYGGDCRCVVYNFPSLHVYRGPGASFGQTPAQNSNKQKQK